MWFNPVVNSDSPDFNVSKLKNVWVQKLCKRVYIHLYTIYRQRRCLTPFTCIHVPTYVYIYIHKCTHIQALGLQRRVFTSVTLGAVVTAWIFSGMYVCMCNHLHFGNIYAFIMRMYVHAYKHMDGILCVSE
jgi:hypothetical protein